ncbi:hypothetical protein GCM10023196_026130 [Actinoallomurus vinaceus]|uniref:DUF1508 domain-containing protein n=1 Tax=Actinoallomurus vinaceus TaxID=1080074 RepID=A0ABP8U9J3_9ACTN
MLAISPKTFDNHADCSIHLEWVRAVVKERAPTVTRQPTGRWIWALEAGDGEVVARCYAPYLRHIDCIAAVRRFVALSGGRLGTAAKPRTAPAPDPDLHLTTNTEVGP